MVPPKIAMRPDPLSRLKENSSPIVNSNSATPNSAKSRMCSTLLIHPVPAGPSSRPARRYPVTAF